VTAFEVKAEEEKPKVEPRGRKPAAKIEVSTFEAKVEEEKPKLEPRIVKPVVKLDPSAFEAKVEEKPKLEPRIVKPAVKKEPSAFEAKVEEKPLPRQRKETVIKATASPFIHLDVARENPKKKRTYSIKPSNNMQANAALIAMSLAQKQAPKPVDRSSIRASMHAAIRASVHGPPRTTIGKEMKNVLSMPTTAGISRAVATV